MDRADFWRLIEGISLSKSINRDFENLLNGLELNEIVSFENHINEMVTKAYTAPMLEACFVILSYVSDDVFDDFLFWLVTAGSERFFAAVENPENIAGWLNKGDVNQIRESLMVILPLRVYKAKGGSEDDFYDSKEYFDNPDISVAWPDDKSEYFKKYPLLTGKFWDQKMINELHSD